MTMIKFADRISSVNARLAEIQATTTNLSLAEKQTLLESLTKDVQAAAAKEDGPKRRLASVKAASISSDPRTKDAFTTAIKGLQSLGYDLEAVAGSGSIADIEAKMRERKWDATRCTGLKVALARIGAIA
jgi:hypothetical protein